MANGRNYGGPNQGGQNPPPGGQNPGYNDPNQGQNPNYNNPNPPQNPTYNNPNNPEQPPPTYGDPGQGNPNPGYGDPNTYPTRDYGDPNPGYGPNKPPAPLPPPSKNKCKDKKPHERPTGLTLIKERRVVCDLVYETKGTVAQLHEKYRKEVEILKERQFLFRKTEGNYQRYRNFDIMVGTELLQFNESVKTSVTSFTKVYKDLNETLKNIAKGAKDLKLKITDLKEAGSKLYNCVNDDCNKVQRKALTGTAPGCEKKDPIPICIDAADILEELIYRPLGLLHDVDYIFKSSYEVVGIQSFSSVDSLESLQKKLDEQSKKLGKWVTETSKSREGDLKKLQDDMVKSVQEVEKAWLDLNHQRSNFEGYRDAAAFLCNPDCKCPDPKEPDNYKDRHPLSRPLLKGCQEKICEICKVVDNAFCCKPIEEPKPNPTPLPTPKPNYA